MWITVIVYFDFCHVSIWLTCIYMYVSLLRFVHILYYGFNVCKLYSFDILMYIHGKRIHM